jgi:hypothetical protein
MFYHDPGLRNQAAKLVEPLNSFGYRGIGRGEFGTNIIQKKK